MPLTVVALEGARAARELSPPSPAAAACGGASAGADARAAEAAGRRLLRASSPALLALTRTGAESPTYGVSAVTAALGSPGGLLRGGRGGGSPSGSRARPGARSKASLLAADLPPGRPGANPRFGLQGRSIAGVKVPIAEAGVTVARVGLGRSMSAPSLGGRPAPAPAAAAALAAGATAPARRGPSSPAGAATGQGHGGGESPDAEPRFELRVRSMAGEELAVFADAQASWTGATIARRLRETLPPGPPGRTYGFVRGSGGALPMAGTLGPGPAELVAVAGTNEAFAELDRARETLNCLSKPHLEEARSYTAPPAACREVADAVLAVLGEERGWTSWKRVSGDPGFFMRLAQLDVESRAEEIFGVLAPYIALEHFVPDVLRRTSQAFSVLCAWCCSLYAYCKGAQGL